MLNKALQQGQRVRVLCVLTASELGTVEPDLIVFPEGTDCKEIKEAQSSYPNSVIVGAIVDNGHSRGVLLHRGQKNRIYYLKVETDGRTKGTGNVKQEPVYEFGDVCIGVLICMDIDHTEFSQAVIESIKSSSASLKFLCVPADMGPEWFPDDRLPFPEKFDGIHVILCNHIKTHGVVARCKSFITDTNGNKIVKQRESEPIGHSIGDNNE